MSVCVDRLRMVNWSRGLACHLFTDDEDLDALHSLARRIGLQRSWFQDDERLPPQGIADGVDLRK